MVYQCNICTAYFTERADNFQRHMLSHSQPRQFACQQCPMKFNLRQHLNCHIKAKHTPKAVIEVLVAPKKTRIEDIINNDQGLSFFHDPAIPEEPYESIFNWEPTAKDDVAANLDQLSAMLEGEAPEEPVEESTVEIEVVSTGSVQKATPVYHHKCGLCNFHHISSVALAAHQKVLHPARCCFFCGQVKFY